MTKYYCGLCETSHHELKKRASCPDCGRVYCIDSIKETNLEKKRLPLPILQQRNNNPIFVTSILKT